LQNIKYDIIIIGAGLGGLVTAALLSKEGKKVLVLEKNKQIGGALQSFGIDKKLFESAVHYIGSLNKGETLHKLYDYLGILNDLKLKRLDLDCFDEIILNDKSYKLAQGHDCFTETLSQYFPTEINGIRKYINEVKNVCSHFPLYNMRIGSAEEKQQVIGKGFDAFINQSSNNGELIQVLGGNNLLYAGNQQQTPFYLHALIQNSYIESSWKFEEGSAQLAISLKNIIQQHGGEVFRNQEVKLIKENHGLIQYVETTDGVQFIADAYISNMNPDLTYQMLDSNLIRPITRKRISATPLTKSSFMVNISLKENEVIYKNHNIYFHKSADVWFDLKRQVVDDPQSFGIFFYQDKNNPAYASAISILCYNDFDAYQQWEKSMHTTTYSESRDDLYQTYKQNLMSYCIDAVTEIIPNLKQSIVKMDACTPLTYRDYLNTPKGSLYGFQTNVDDLANTTYSTQTKIPNLYFTGQNINLHGVLGVSITAILTAADFVGLPYLVNKINQHANKK
jgi:all-trans-retinol 13,14-reductase